MRFITISGPQSSGKSTVFKYLAKKYSNRGIKFVGEINPYKYTKTDHPRYLTTFGIQETLTKKTLELLKKIGNKTDFIMETGPMQIVYVHSYSGKEKAEYYFDEYVKICKKLNPFIIYIDTKPEISFRRRKKVYLERIKRHKLEDRKEEVMYQYKKKIFDLYPLWKKWFKKYPFEKHIIRNSYKTEKQFINEVERLVNTLLSKD